MTTTTVRRPWKIYVCFWVVLSDLTMFSYEICYLLCVTSIFLQIHKVNYCKIMLYKRTKNIPWQKWLHNLQLSQIVENYTIALFSVGKKAEIGVLSVAAGHSTWSQLISR